MQRWPCFLFFFFFILFNCSEVRGVTQHMKSLDYSLFPLRKFSSHISSDHWTMSHPDKQGRERGSSPLLLAASHFKQSNWSFIKWKEKRTVKKQLGHWPGKCWEIILNPYLRGQRTDFNFCTLQPQKIVRLPLACLVGKLLLASKSERGSWWWNQTFKWRRRGEKEKVFLVFSVIPEAPYQPFARHWTTNPHYKETVVFSDASREPQ